MDKLLHTPEGVRDIYNGECERKVRTEQNIKKVMKKYGFAEIQTPTFEYFDVFSEERGTVASKDMYKFFDRAGNTLVLRPDITPSIVRCVAKYYKNEDMPIRLFYSGNTFINNNEYQGKLKENSQLGAEIFNDSSVEADAEMLALVVDCLRRTGLEKFQVEVGQADFFRAIVSEAGLNEEETERLRQSIIDKNMFGVDEIISERTISQKLKELFMRLPELFGNVSVLAEIKQMTDNKEAIKTIERLEKLYSLLEVYGFEKYITFDLGTLSQYNYYTGIIFHAYTYGTGNAIVTGGRYDSLAGQFGKNAPAVGMGILLDQLMAALMRQKIDAQSDEKKVLILYTDAQYKKAVEKAAAFRSGNVGCLLQRYDDRIKNEEYEDYALRMGINDILKLL